MSATHDTLASYTRTTGYGPTQTKTTTRRFEQNLRGVLRRINATIKQAIIEDDIFALQDSGADTLAVDDPPPLREESNARQTALFTQWLREQLDTELLEIVTRGENPYIRSAYAQGIRLATRDLRERGLDPGVVDISRLVEQGQYNRGLRVLFNRTYEFLDDTADELTREVRDELMEGFSKGESPSVIAGRLTDRVDSVGKHRATVIARTEVINAHTEGYLNRVEDISRDLDADIAVGHHWQTAEDDDVCPICRPLNGVRFTTDEMRDATFTLAGGTWQLKPPAHPQCRCTLVPDVGVSQDDLPALSERLPEGGG